MKKYTEAELNKIFSKGWKKGKLSNAQKKAITSVIFDKNPDRMLVKSLLLVESMCFYMKEEMEKILIQSDS